jgi:flagellar hook assembly protein FlgD
VASTPEETALSTRLVGNAPNPFNPRTTISFDLGQSGPVRLEIFDVRGRLVRTVDNRVFSAGSHSVLWDGRDNQGGDTASGLYFFRMTTDSASETHKMLLVR